jgi:hypothetical protein
MTSKFIRFNLIEPGIPVYEKLGQIPPTYLYDGTVVEIIYTADSVAITKIENSTLPSKPTARIFEDTIKINDSLKYKYHYRQKGYDKTEDDNN